MFSARQYSSVQSKTSKDLKVIKIAYFCFYFFQIRIFRALLFEFGGRSAHSRLTIDKSICWTISIAQVTVEITLADKVKFYCELQKLQYTQITAIGANQKSFSTEHNADPELIRRIVWISRSLFKKLLKIITKYNLCTPNVIIFSLLSLEALRSGWAVKLTHLNFLAGGREGGTLCPPSISCKIRTLNAQYSLKICCLGSSYGNN